jgi:hypothetical protein
VSEAIRLSLTELVGAGPSEHAGRYEAPSHGIVVAEPVWVVASRTDLAASSTHTTYTDAASLLAASNGSAGGPADQRIVGAFEAAGV